jgi:hypothetical protein
MGLDMYLTKKRFLWGDERKKMKIEGVEGINPEKVSEITEDVMYWRKANAIHKWFVDNVQNGVDDCKEYYVEREQLEELLKLCKEIVKVAVVAPGPVQNGFELKDGNMVPILENGTTILNPEEVAKILPNQSGFFFGSTDYDEWYLRDIEATIEGLEIALKDNDGDFYYSASW